MAKKRTKMDLGIRLKPTDVAGTQEGDISIGDTSKFVKVYIDGSERNMVSEDQTQSLTNKTIDGTTATGTNTISIDADDASYDNAVSGLAATDVKAALDEIDGNLDAHLVDAVDAHDASAISNTPSGNLAATDLQGAVNELQSDIDTRALDSDLTAHINDATDAHDASAVSYVNTTSGLTATDVQAAVDEVEGRLDTAETGLSDHIADPTGAHAASAISNTPSGNLAATDIQGAVNELQTDIDTRATSTDLTTHTSATAAHGTTGDIVGTTDTQTLTNKTITGASIQTPTRADVKQDTQANLETYAATASNGQLAFATDTKKMYQVVDNALVDVGSGSGGINYIADVGSDTADIDLGDWVTYADVAGENAVDGTGGTSTTTLTRNTTTPLRGDGDFLITKDAANRQGEGCSVDFTIAKADLAKKLYIDFNFLTSANYADGDIRIQVYDVTNSRLIRCNGEDLSGKQGNHLAWFQSDATSTSYRLIFHVSSTNASAYTVNFDDVRVGPRDVAVTANRIRLVEASGNAGTTITANSTDIDFTADYDLLGAWSGTVFTAPNTGFYEFSGATVYSSGIARFLRPIINGSHNGEFFGVVSANSTAAFDYAIQLNKGDTVAFEATVGGTLQNNSAHVLKVIGPNPAQVSEDIGNREVVGYLFESTDQNLSNNVWTKLTYTTSSVVVDTVDFFDDAQDGFVIPETGYYDINAFVQFASNATSYREVRFAINGSISLAGSRHAAPTAGGARITATDISRKLNKGDIITVHCRQNSGGTLAVADSAFQIAKRAMPQTLLETETVAAHYTSNSGQTIEGSSTSIEYEDKVFDTHNAYNTSTGDYTVPISGWYQVHASFTMNTAKDEGRIYIRVNGSNITFDRIVNNNGSTVQFLNPQTTTYYYFEKGDIVDIHGDTNGGGSATLQTSSPQNRFQIARIK